MDPWVTSLVHAATVRIAKRLHDSDGSPHFNARHAHGSPGPDETFRSIFRLEPQDVGYKSRFQSFSPLLFFLSLFCSHRLSALLAHSIAFNFQCPLQPVLLPEVGMWLLFLWLNGNMQKKKKKKKKKCRVLAGKRRRRRVRGNSENRTHNQHSFDPATTPLFLIPTPCIGLSTPARGY